MRHGRTAAILPYLRTAFAPTTSEGRALAVPRLVAAAVQLPPEPPYTAEEIADAKKGWLQSRNVSRATDRELASTLSLRD